MGSQDVVITLYNHLNTESTKTPENQGALWDAKLSKGVRQSWQQGVNTKTQGDTHYQNQSSHCLKAVSWLELVKAYFWLARTSLCSEFLS